MTFQTVLNICGFAFIVQVVLMIGFDIIHRWNLLLTKKYQRDNLKKMLEFESALRETRERLAAEGKSPEEIKKEMIPGTPTMEDIKKKYGHLFVDQLKKPKEE